jgi:uncharacterized paraquat-inducible protein A
LSYVRGRVTNDRKTQPIIVADQCNNPTDTPRIVGYDAASKRCRDTAARRLARSATSKLQIAIDCIVCIVVGTVFARVPSSNTRRTHIEKIQTIFDHETIV